MTAGERAAADVVEAKETPATPAKSVRASASNAAPRSPQSSLSARASEPLNIVPFRYVSIASLFL